MNKKDKFFMLLALSCLPLSEMAAEQVDGMAVSPITQEVLQNSVKITGKVVDVQGEPVIGATVMEKGTTNGIITDVDGNFTLNVSPNRKLQVSYVGYQTQEITIGSNRTLRITLKEDSELLDEVVVVGYGTMKKSDLTGAVSSVSTQDLMRSGRTDAVGAMQGALPGVQIQRSNNKPGGEYNILIRGLNTISGSTSPLIVVDGVPGASLSNLNPDDIEKIDILKDASSTAIYGSRATNGVVMVTTKRGKIGKVKIDYSGYAGYRKYTNMPDMMSGEEYVQLAREAKRAGNNNEYVDDSQIFTTSELKAIQDGNYFDWVDAVSKPAFMTNHTISATGGNEMATYALSAGYYFENGMLEPQEYSRYNLRAVVDVKPSKYMKFGINMYGTHSVRDTGNSDLLQDAFRLRPTYHPTDLVTGEEMWAYSNGQYNALTTMKNELNKTKKYNLLSNIYLEVTPMQGLTLKTTFSPDINLEEIGQYRGKYTKANKGQNKATSNYAKNSYVDWVWDNLVNYNFQLKDHRVDLTGVFSMQQSQDEKLKGIGNGLSYNSLWYNLAGGSASNTSSSGFTKTNLMSYLARANYVYKDKYFLTASIRLDGSSKLAEGNKWGSFPSVAVAWRVSEEEFMKSLSWLSNLKLRLSYGQTGNDNVSAYQTQGSISGAKYYTFGSNESIGYVPNNLRNLDLGWERTTEYNVGIDFGLLNNRISGSVEYYNRLTEDLIMNKTVPVTTGYSSVKANVGSVRNEGFEVNIHSDNIRTKDFSWRTSLNFAYNKNKIVDLQYKEDLTSRGQFLAGMSGDYSNLWIIGQPIDINYNLMTLGVWQLDEAEEAAKYGCKPGDVKIRDLKQDGQITADDKKILGSTDPKYIVSLGSSFKWKNLDFSFNLSSRWDYVFYDDAYGWHVILTGTRWVPDVNYWTPDNPSNDYPRADATWADHRELCGYMKGDYIKMQDMTLGYDFHSLLKRYIPVSKARFYVQLRNAFYLYRAAKEDVIPESPSIELTVPKSINFGVNLTF